MFDHILRAFFQEGALMVRLPDGKLVSIGGAREEDAPLIVHVRTAKAAARIARDPGLAAGEAYMDGDLVIERGDLYDFLAVAARNLARFAARRRGLRAWWRRWKTHRNGAAKARRNVAHHYDLSGELYRLFLDADRQYSCAYFSQPGMSLEAAQAAKKRHLAAKLLLEPGQRVLDIGSGWGGLALTLAGEHGADVTGITLSAEQLHEARQRAARSGLDRRVRFEMKDYRAVEGAFDRIVSVGMFEHVGPGDYQAYFDAIARLLKQDGVAVIHTIGRFDGPNGGNAWIEKYIFPGGRIPALSEIVPAVERAGLILTDVEILRQHYADTLRAWRERFKARWAEAAALYDERFCRMWDFYLAGSEAGFREGELVVFQLQLAKQRNVVPVTRDYITDFERTHEAPHAIAAE